MRRFLLNRYLQTLILTAFCNLAFAGCYSVREITNDDFESVEVLKIEKTDGEIVDFTDDPQGYAIIADSSIIRTDQNNLKEKIPLSEIRTIYADKFDPDKTFYFSLAILFGIGILVGLTFSLDGPLGG